MAVNVRRERAEALAKRLRELVAEMVPEVVAGIEPTDVYSKLQMNVSVLDSDSRGKLSVRELDVDFYEQEGALEGLVRAIRAWALGREGSSDTPN